MVLSLELSCAMCAETKDVKIKIDHLDGATPIKAVVESAGWITQQNGENFDIYCSKRCAA
jgi:hypothetical protein